MDPSNRAVVDFYGQRNPSTSHSNTTQHDSQSSLQNVSQSGASANPFIGHVQMAQHLSPNGWSVLDMGGMLIHSLSAAKLLFSTYTFLTTLYLNHNNLTFLPPAIQKLNHLVVLDVSGNRLQWLPPEIGNLKQLRELWIFDNYLETLPWELAWLIHMRYENML